MTRTEPAPASPPTRSPGTPMTRSGHPSALKSLPRPAEVAGPALTGIAPAPPRTMEPPRLDQPNLVVALAVGTFNTVKSIDAASAMPMMRTDTGQLLQWALDAARDRHRPLSRLQFCCTVLLAGAGSPGRV